MNRIIRGISAKKKRNKIIKYTKGCAGSHSKLFSTAKQQYMKSYNYSYFDRRKKKSQYKKIWINRINCKLKSNNSKYNLFIKKLKKDNINLNRKIIQKISLIDKAMFDKIA